MIEPRVVGRISAPTVDPDERDPVGVAATDRYRPADRVWVYRGGAWRAGIVEVSSSRAATVTYRPTGSGGTAVDTMVARDLLPRTDPDPLLDPAD